MSTDTVPGPSPRPIRTCNGCGRATTDYTEHDVLGVTHVVCANCAVANPAPQLNRARVREAVAAARTLLREAARLSDGDLPTVRHNLTTAIVATDDAMDALQGAVEADLREWADAHGENALLLATEARGEC